MPTNNHELPLEMVRNRPQLVPEMLRTVFGLDVSGQARATLASESYADTNPAELRCDATVLLGDPKSPVMGIVVESQLRVLKQKSYSWPAYLASLRAPAHADGPQSEAVLQGLSAAIGSLSGDTGKLYYDYVLSRFSDAARKLMEETVKLDNYEWQSEFAITHRAEGRAEGLAEGEARGEAKGKAKGEVRALLLMLEARGLDVPADVRARVQGCTDLEQIERWIQRAISADSAEDLFT